MRASYLRVLGDVGGPGRRRLDEQDLPLELGHGDERPQRPPQLAVRQLGGQPQVLEGEALVAPVLPAEEHRHLEGGHVQVELADAVGQRDGPVRHVVVPLQLPPGVLVLKGHFLCKGHPLNTDALYIRAQGQIM